jgi:hypothetical protein
MSDREHCAFIALVDRLRASAEQAGDTAFAEALAECFLFVSGGNLDCPMGQLILEDTLRSGKPPGASLPAPSAPEPSEVHRPPQPTVLKRRERFDQLRHLLMKDAMWKHDARYLEALAACERLTTVCDQPGGEVFDCPIRRLLRDLREQDGGGHDPAAQETS